MLKEKLQIYKVLQKKVMSPQSHNDLTAIQLDLDTPQNINKKYDIQWFKRQIRKPQIIFNGIIIILAPLIMLLAEYGYMPSTKMGFTCADPLISHKYNGEVIIPETLGVTSVLIPISMLLLTEFLMNGTLKNANIYRLWFYFRECLIGGTLTLTLTEMGKLIVGEHRPHFFDVCQPDTAKNCTPGTFIEDFQCTSTQYDQYFLVDSSRSFPSGHSSVSVFIGIYSAYLVQTRLPVAKTGILMKPFLICVCLTWSLLCSLTRITDRRHHWWDVLTGMILGALVASYTLRMIHRKMYIAHNGSEKSSESILLDIRQRNEEDVV